MALPLDWAMPLHDRNDPDINMSFNYLACRLPALIRRIQGCSVISKKASIISLPSGPVAVAIISLLSCFVAMAHAREGCPGAMPGAVLEKPMEVNSPEFSSASPPVIRLSVRTLTTTITSS